MKTKTELAVKPYASCLSCKHRKVRCDGLRTSPMDLITWCAYMRDMKEANKLTNAHIAEKSGVSIKTIERIMALNCEQDIMRDTARRIENAIVGSSNQHPCYLMLEENAPAETNKLLDGIHASYNAEMQTIREEAKRKVDYLLEQIEKMHKEIEYWRLENDRKAKTIDRLLDK